MCCTNFYIYSVILGFSLANDCGFSLVLGFPCFVLICDLRFAVCGLHGGRALQFTYLIRVV